MDEKTLEEVLHDGVHRSLLSTPAIWRRWEQLGPLRRGAGRVRTVLERQTSARPPESVLETRFLQLIRDADLPLPLAQFEVPGVARIDFAHPDSKIAIELDGARYHSSPDARERDRRRENQLVALGWRVLRFTWADVTERPDRVLALMRSLGAHCAPSERIEKGA